MDKIRLLGMEFYGYHGVYAEENRLGQRFVVELELCVGLESAGKTDQINNTLNYAEVALQVKSIVEGKSFQLIEALAENIASTLLECYHPLKQVKVCVSKPHPPIPIHLTGIEVEIVRKRV
jgi:dihydroneopterin aldolase